MKLTAGRLLIFVLLLGGLVVSANYSNISALLASVKLGVLPSFECGVSTVQDADGNTYDTVLIGTQCWMKQNMIVGTRVNVGTTQSNNATTEKYCYGDIDSYCTGDNPNYPDGGLYQWDEAMQYSTTEGAQGICPAGWHIPTHDEWTILERAICTSGSCATDFPYDVSTTDWRGTTEGTKLKPNGTSGLEFNLTGSVYLGAYYNWGTFGFYWSSSESGSNAWVRYVYSAEGRVNRVTSLKSNGLSVRCLKDDPFSDSSDPKVTIATTPALSATDPLNDGLVGHWTFDGPDVDLATTSDSVSDVSSQDNHLDIVSLSCIKLSSATQGIVGQALHFSSNCSAGAQGLRNLATSFSGTAQKTISYWVKPTNTGLSMHTLNQGLGASNPSNGWIHYIGSAGELLFRVGYSTTDLLVGTNSGVIKWNEWQQVTLTWTNSSDASQVKVYLNGVEISKTTAQNGVGTRETESSAMYLGRSAGGSSVLEGSLDDIRVYERVLSADEVMRLYEMSEGTNIATTIKNPLSPLEQGLVGHWTFDGMDVDWASTTAEIEDVSGNGNNGDAQNGMSTRSPTPGKLGQAMSFGLTNDVVDVGSSANLDDVFDGGGSISAWVRTGTVWNGGTKDVLQKDGVSSGFYLGHTGPPNTAYTQVRFLRTFNTTNGQWRSSQNVFTAGEWFHVVVTYDDSSTANDPVIYINGVADTDSEFTTPSGTPLSDASANMKIGSASGSTLDDVRVYDRILTPAEVSQLYQMGH